MDDLKKRLPNMEVYNIIIIVLTLIMSIMLLLFIGVKYNGWFRRKLPGEKCNFETGWRAEKCGISLLCLPNPSGKNPEYTCQIPINNDPDKQRCRSYCSICT